jgi:uncharacterized protein
MIVDAHTHAFPDAVAERAIPFLEEEGQIRANLDGTVASLIASMDRAGIKVSVVASIATKPTQFASILSWSKSIASDRIVPLASVHPDDPDVLEHIGDIKAAGCLGLKLHPYYQKFSLTEDRIYRLFERIDQEGLIVLLHTGFDIAYEHIRIVDPIKIRALIDTFPGLKLIASHFGAWSDWDEVDRYLLGRELYIDTSHSMQFMGDERVRRFLLEHSEEHLLFGTDSPWGNQADDLRCIDAFDLPGSRRKKLLGDNAAKLLGL